MKLLKGFEFDPHWMRWCELFYIGSAPSKTYTRIYLFAGKWFIEARNNFGGQLNGWFCAGIFLNDFWKYGPRFLWSTNRVTWGFEIGKTVHRVKV